MEFKIETDLNGDTHLVKYNNDDGEILLTSTLEHCKNKLSDIIRSRHRITHITYKAWGEVIDHENEKSMQAKEFIEGSIAKTGFLSKIFSTK